MVRNDEIRREFNMFSDIWTVYKALLPVRGRHDKEYWDSVTDSLSEIMRKYPGQFAKDIALAVLGDLERRCRENENQDTGCKAVS